MNSRFVSVPALLLALAVATTRTSGAQDAPAFKRTADSIAVLFHAAEIEWKEYRRLDSLRMLSLPIANAGQRVFKVGGVTVVADTSVAALAERTVREVLRQMEQMYGSGVAALSSEQWTLTIRENRDTTGRLKNRRLQAGYRVIGDGNRVEEGGATTAKLPGIIADFWRRRSDVVMRRAMDSAAGIWVGRSIGAGEKRENLSHQVFRELAIGSNALAPECYRHNLTACRKALAMEQGDLIGGALSEAARASLLRLALETGGSEAFARFMADTSQSISTRIEAAARIPVDTLVGRWLDLTIATRPQPASASLPTALLALFWSSLLCVVSLRSSRWR